VVGKYTSIPVLWCWGGLAAGILLLWLLRGSKIFLTVFVLVMAFAGILWARLDARVPMNSVENFAGPERVVLRGVADTLPEVKTRGKKSTVSLVLRASFVTRQERGHWKRKKVVGDVQVFLLQSQVLPQLGDELRLYGTLDIPRKVLNPGEFDYGSFLAQKKIRAVFQVIGKKSVRVIGQGAGAAPSRWIPNIRRSVGLLIDRLYGVREASFLKALVIGLRSDVPAAVRDDFFKSGTIHLLPTPDGKWNYTLF